ncbi:MAG: dTDP-4-amino-4,6-dideoxygalactose transaminase [Gammaproteobacteria bacterium]
MSSIPFNKPCLAGAEAEYVQQALTGEKLSGGGSFTAACQTLLEEMTGSVAVLLTSSCTHALELAALLADVGADDEVIMPSFTFSSTANAFCLRGARPVFVDIRPDTLNLDENQIEAAVTDRTRAIVPVHYAGVACEMGRIRTIAERHGLAVIEDAAHAIGASFRGRTLGSLGDMGCFSFHDTKTLICGEGGAIALNRPELVERAEILREKGTDRSRFLRGEVDKYTWVDVGSSYLMGEMAAAMLLGQLEASARVFALRRAIWERYRADLAPLAERGLLSLPVVPGDCAITYHMFQLLVRDQATRDALIAHLGEREIAAAFHYVPLHTSPMGLRLRGGHQHLPVTEEVSARLLRLPMFNALGESEQTRVVDEIFRFFDHNRGGD